MTEYSCVSVISTASDIFGYNFIEVDVESGHLWWKKKERIELCSHNTIDWMYPETGKYVTRNPDGLRAAYRKYSISQEGES